VCVVQASVFGAFKSRLASIEALVDTLMHERTPQADVKILLIIQRIKLFRNNIPKGSLAQQPGHRAQDTHPSLIASVALSQKTLTLAFSIERLVGFESVSFIHFSS
jgi:hypothetical protein